MKYNCIAAFKALWAQIPACLCSLILLFLFFWLTLCFSLIGLLPEYWLDRSRSFQSLNLHIWFSFYPGCSCLWIYYVVLSFEKPSWQLVLEQPSTLFDLTLALYGYRKPHDIHNVDYPFMFRKFMRLWDGLYFPMHTSDCPL